MKQVPQKPLKKQQQQPSIQQERAPPAIKPKPMISRKPDFPAAGAANKPEIEIKRPEISNNYRSSGSNIVKVEPAVKKVAPANTGSKVCYQCKETIDGPCATALDHDYHIHHFQCFHCNRALSSRVPGIFF